MNAELEEVARRLDGARRPEDVFGELKGNQGNALRSAYRALTKVCHPDRYLDAHDKETAEQAFDKLQRWHQSAEDKIASGIYGQDRRSNASTARLVVRNRKHTYVVQATPFAQGDMCNVYRCTVSSGARETGAIFKVTRSPADNDLVACESAVLRELASNPRYKQYHAFIPGVMDSFQYQDPSSTSPRRVNVLTFEDGQYYSLRDVREQYKQGVHAKDMAWMWRRLLIALSFTHACGIVHGAVLPTHVLIQPEQHGLVLIDWCYAVSHPDVGDHIPAIATEYQSWYPPEVLGKERPLPCTDLYMGAMCMIYLLGGDPATRAMPESIPSRIQAFFRGVALEKPVMRPQDALSLLDEFTASIEQLWGTRRFRRFVMPK